MRVERWFGDRVAMEAAGDPRRAVRRPLTTRNCLDLERSRWWWMRSFRSERAFGVRSAAVIVPGLVFGVLLDRVVVLRVFPAPEPGGSRSRKRRPETNIGSVCKH